MLVAHTISNKNWLLLALYFIYLAVNRAVKSQVDIGESRPVDGTDAPGRDGYGVPWC